MATLDIAEFIDTSHGNLVEPPIAGQSVELGDEPCQSKPFHKQTRCVRIIADVNCRISIGRDPDAPKFPLRAGVPEQRIVPPETGFRVYADAVNRVYADAVNQGGAGEPSNTGLFIDFIRVASDPAKYKALAERLATAQSEATAASEKFRGLKAQAAALVKERAAFEAWTASERASLQEARHKVDAEREQLEAEKREHATATAALAGQRAAFEESKRAHEATLADIARLRRALAA
jgi:hypothetical protein